MTKASIWKSAQDALVATLLEAGTVIQGPGAVNVWLANGRPQAAEFLVTRCAPLHLEGAAGVGQLDVVKSFFNEDRPSERECHRRADKGRLHVAIPQVRRSTTRLWQSRFRPTRDSDTSMWVISETPRFPPLTDRR